MFMWCKGHHKRGSRDVLVLEERILLLMTTYAPNLYRVFLTYAHDAVGKVRCQCSCLCFLFQSRYRLMLRVHNMVGARNP